MSTDVSTELESFQYFLALQLKHGRKDLTPEETVERFRAYQRDLEQLKHEIEPAIEQCDRGEAEPLDIERVIQDGMRRWNDRGDTK